MAGQSVTAGEGGVTGGAGDSEEAVRRARSALERVRACSEAMRDCAGTGRSADGVAEASVDGLGTPVALRLRRGAGGMRGTDVGDSVVEAFSAAAQQVALQHRALLDGLG